MQANEIILPCSMSKGAPIPKILASEQLLLLIFFIEGEDDIDLPANIIERDSINDRGTAVLEFDSCLAFKFGGPNDELLQQHPYYKAGVGFYSFYEMIESEWLKSIIDLNRTHPRFSEYIFEDCKHYVITFKDSMFECIADSYSLQCSNDSMAQSITRLSDKLILSG